jgi:uncharacterized protein
MKPAWRQHRAYPYVAPFAVYVLLLMGARWIHADAKYAVYPVMVVWVGGMLLRGARKLPSLACKAPLASVGWGLLGAVLWIAPYPWLSSVGPGSTTGFNPAIFENREIQAGLVAMRLIGAVLVVPWMEEVFWRGFLMRHLIREDFESVPLGTYGHLSFWGTTALFVLAHLDQAGVALIFGLLAGAWFLRTRSLGDVVLLHAVTNLALGAYVLATRSWYFW